MPSPPTSCRKQRHTFTDTGRLSSPDRAVAPVAVKALIASKKALLTVMSGTANNSGTMA